MPRSPSVAGKNTSNQAPGICGKSRVGTAHQSPLPGIARWLIGNAHPTADLRLLFLARTASLRPSSSPLEAGRTFRALVHRVMRYTVRITLLISLCALAGCRTVEKSFRPSHFRDWVPEQALLPQAEFDGSQVTIRNVRNCQYFANDVYLVDYYDKTVDLNAVRSVDYIVVPFAGFPALAHTMMSFEIQQPDGNSDYLAVSVETRKEKSERY